MPGRKETMAAAAVLVVDEDPDELQLTRGLLKKENCIAIAAGSGEAALKLVQTNPVFDLVLLSVTLEDINAAEVCRRFKADKPTADLPIVLISKPLESRDQVFEALDAGALGYVAKPCDINALWAWIRVANQVRDPHRARAGAEAESVPCDVAVLKQFARLNHDVNNPLQGLYATVDLLALELPEGSKGRERLERIIACARRVSDVVAEVASAAKRQLRQ